MLFRMSRDEGELIITLLEGNLNSGQAEYLAIVNICDAIRKGFGMICYKCSQSINANSHLKPIGCPVCQAEFNKITEEP